MYRFFLFSLLLISTFSNAQMSCSITGHYGDFIRITKWERYNALIRQAVAVEDGGCFSPLVNGNEDYINYFLTDFVSKESDKELKAIDDSVKLQKQGIDVLAHDSLFNSVMTSLVAKTVEQRLPKDTITIDKLMDVAVKYFMITGINENGYYLGKVCVGKNLVAETEKKRWPQLEAFCFTSILRNTICTTS